MTSAQDAETSVITYSPSQDSFHPDNPIPSKYVTPGFKPFAVVKPNAKGINIRVKLAYLHSSVFKIETTFIRYKINNYTNT